MNGADLLAWFRNSVISEPYNDRITDDQALSLIAQGSRNVAKRTRAIEGRQGIQVGIQQPNMPALQEWQLPTDRIVAIRRVYMVTQGSCQRLKHTSIPQMEGDQLRIFGNEQFSSTVFGNQGWIGQTTTSVPGSVNQYWQTLPPQPYPIASCYRGVGYSPLPMYPGAPPSYYLRGTTVIGIVPRPIAAAMLVLDTYAMPQDFILTAFLAAGLQESPFPMDFKEAICWDAARIFYHSDQSVGTDSLEADAAANYENSVKDLISWTDNFNEDDPQGPQLLTHRQFYGAERLGVGSYGGWS